MKIAIAQINTIVGALRTNSDKSIQYINSAYEKGADIVLLPEATITGYMALDLLFNAEFIKDNIKELHRIKENIPKDIVAVIGFIDEENDKLYNSAAVMQRGKISGIVRKIKLPVYDVFNELRYYTAVSKTNPVNVNIKGKQVRLGIQICEDMWDETNNNVTSRLASEGAELILNISASPFQIGKKSVRERLVSKHAKENSIPFFYCNLIGGQDEVVFDGSSLVADTNGSLIHISPSFKEELSVIDLEMIDPLSTVTPSMQDQLEDIFNAIRLGIKDYIVKSGFDSAILGLSGGVDSSLVAVLAVEALGPENVTGISMPSRFSSEHSKSDAELLANNLNMNFKTLPIEDPHKSFLALLEDDFHGKSRNETEENLQARIRGNILMAFSNKFGYFPLATGNKTEMALGYATMYGDMAGGLAPISDVSKTKVYELCRYYNELKGEEIIPLSVLSKKPSAELSEAQYDPFDYDVVSPLVDELIENGSTKAQLLEKGYDEDTIDKIIFMIKKSEYKRRQAPPGIKITTKAFGIGRRMPLINHYNGK